MLDVQGGRRSFYVGTTSFTARKDYLEVWGSYNRAIAVVIKQL